MRSNWRPLTCAILSTFFVLLLTACGLSSAKTGYFAGTDSATTVSVALTGPSTVTLGAQSQYAATVTGSSDASVTWSVNGVAGGNASVGSISSQGMYLAPTSAPQSSQVTITATSVASPTASQSLAVALAAQSQSQTPTGASAVTVLLDGATSVTLGTSSQYAAIVTGTSDTALAWSVNGVAGGNASVGIISATGLYTAPASAPSSSKVTITATSVGDPSASQSLAVTLVATVASAGGGGSNVTLALSGPTKVTLASSAHYAATVTGSSDTAVTWSVNGVIGGDTTLGTISGNGTYTAPAKEPASSKVTITVTSAVDPSVSQSLAVTLAAPASSGGGTTVTLTLSGPTSVTLGSSSQYAATVNGSSNTGVTWSVDGIVGGDAAYGYITTKGRYSAPANASSSSKVTIKATSLADPSVAQGMAITLMTPTPPSGGGPVTLTLTGAASVTLGSSSQYSATVSGSANTAVKWSVNGVAGGNATDGSISAGGLYTAPSTAPQPSTVTIAATSVANPTVAKSLVTTLVPPTGTSRIPSNAISSGVLDGSKNWEWQHDPGTPGSSQGSSVYPATGLSSDNAAREYYMTYSGRSGELFHLSFGKDLNATHFVYDAYVYVNDPSQLANLEMDMNDVMPDGRTVILGTQCSSYSKSWEYTYYSAGFHWHPSNIPCNPETWSAKTWHHIQIASQRDSNGVATYDWVNVDGVYSDFQNATVNSAESLGWALGDLLINFQIDGSSAGSGSNTLYTDKLQVWRW
jgi:hypothetical protein